MARQFSTKRKSWPWTKRGSIAMTIRVSKVIDYGVDTVFGMSEAWSLGSVTFGALSTHGYNPDRSKIVSAVVACENCGAPGQIIGNLCEYCGVRK
jgi:hypothetical protein